MSSLPCGSEKRILQRGEEGPRQFHPTWTSPCLPGCKCGKEVTHVGCPSLRGQWVSPSLHPLPYREGGQGPSRTSSQASSSLRGTVPSGFICCPLAHSLVDICPHHVWLQTFSDHMTVLIFSLWALVPPSLNKAASERPQTGTTRNKRPWFAKSAPFFMSL